MTRYYYSAESAHGDAYSYGFSNDTIVYAWANRKSRDQYVADSHNLSCEAIRRDQVTKYAANYDLSTNDDGRPRPFSGEFWAIEKPWSMLDELPTGLVGQVVVCGGYEHSGIVTRFYS